MSDVRRAYDGAAAAYDDLFVSSNRAAWQAVYLPRVRPGSRVLDLGCGTGADSVACALAGGVVTGADISPEMLVRARNRAVEAGVAIRFVEADLSRLPSLGAGRFDLALSGFAALNTVADVPAFATSMAEAIRPGGELLLHFLTPGGLFDRFGDLSRGRVRAAFMHWSVRDREVTVGDTRVRHRLYRPGFIYEAAFAPYFTRERTRGVGLCTPDDGPSRVPAGLRPALHALDGRAGAVPGLRELGRFAILVLRRM